jgi:hypothetical protein
MESSSDPIHFFILDGVNPGLSVPIWLRSPGNRTYCSFIVTSCVGTNETIGGNDEHMDNLVRDSADRLARRLHGVSRSRRADPPIAGVRCHLPNHAFRLRDPQRGLVG